MKKLFTIALLIASIQLLAQPISRIPINMHNKHIYVEGTINNVKGNFLFDTGATNLYLDSTYYNKGNLKFDSIGLAKLPGAGEQPQEVKLIMNNVTMQFADNKYETTMVPILSFKSIVGEYGDGILGVDYFLDKVMEVNFEDSYLQTYQHIGDVNKEGYTKIAMKNCQSKRYCVPLTVVINDSLTITDDFLLDFGSGGTVSFVTYLAKEYSFAEKIKDKLEQESLSIGKSYGYAFRAKLLEIGGYELENIYAEYSIDKAGAFATKDYAGLLGNEVLRRFYIIIDFKNSDLYLKPNKNFSDEFKSRKRKLD